jgi:hypothetical protein
MNGHFENNKTQNMKILFSPEYSGHVFIALNEHQPERMDTQVCDTTALVDLLELRLGIHVEEQTLNHRLVLYYKALSEYMKHHPDNILAASFHLSGLDTAKQALHWRDSLMMDKWKPTAGSDNGRLEVLAATEAYFHCPGLPDRIATVIQYINKVEKDYFADIEIELPCSKELLHPAIGELLTALEGVGAVVSYTAPSLSGESNLAKVARLIQADTEEHIELTKGDSSFLIYRFPDENAANEYFSLKGDELNASLWINSNNKAMDNWLRMMGKPTMGSCMNNATPQLMQLFVSGLDMMKEPLNIQSLISWLYAPMQPLGSFFGSRLAETIINNGGYRNIECQEVVNDYILGKYTYHDPEEDALLSDQEKAKRDAHEQKERKKLAKVYLPSFEVKEQLETVSVQSYLNSLSAWATSRAHVLREKPNNEGWISQLENLAQMCDSFVLLLNSSAMGAYVDWTQVDSWVSTLYRGETFLQYAPQVGCRELIDSPAKMAARSQRTVWMNFWGTNSPQLDTAFLYPSERKAIENSLAIWDEHKETAYHQQMEMLPLLMTDEQLILVVTDYVGGEPAQKHPFMIKLESLINKDNLQEFILTPSLLEEKTEEVKVVNNKIEQPQITFDHTDLLEWPDHMSPTSMDTLVEYPLDFLMEKMLHIVNTGPSSLKDIKTTKGDVAHAVIEGLFAPRDGKHCSTADEIEQRIKLEFDQQVRKSIEARGAILYLPENKLEAELLKEQLQRCLKVLLQILRDNHLSVTGCEHQVLHDMGLMETEKGWDMKGFIDMTLEDDHHHPVVFDFKWTSSKGTSKKGKYRMLLEQNRSTQLELYRAMLSAEQHDAVERVAYFLMPEGHLYSQELFHGLHCTQLKPDNNNNIVAQLKNSFFYRKKQIDSGLIEIGEGFPATMLNYYNDTEAEALFPLNIEEGVQENNNFSKNGLFKRVKEVE